MTPERYLHLDDHADLLEMPEHAAANQYLGLPLQSVVLNKIIDGRSPAEIGPLLHEIATEAPFLTTQTIFTNNLSYFIENMPRAKELQNKIMRMHMQTSCPILQITGFLADIFANRRLTGEIDALEALHLFIDAVLESRVQVFQNLAQLCPLCRSATDFKNLLKTFKQNPETDLDQLRFKSKMSFPRMMGLGIKILDGCRVQCQFCSEDTKANPDEWQMLTMDDFRALQPILEEVGQVAITGGEPMDHPELLEICRFLSELKVPFTLNTSGGEREQLEELLPMLHDGSIRSITVSINNQFGALGKRRSSQTAAFLVQQNVPFKAHFTAPRLAEMQDDIQPLVNDLRCLGLDFAGAENHKGTQVNNFAPAHSLGLREASVRLVMAPMYPGGRWSDNPDALENLRQITRQASQGGDSSGFCRLQRGAPPVIRADRTVSPCDNNMEGGCSGVTLLMDRLPRTIGQLLQAKSRYSRRMRGIYREANQKGVLPCVVHREKGK